MPSLPNVNKVLRVDLFQSEQGNTRVRDRLFFAYAGAGGTVNDLITLASTIRTAWATNISPLMNTGHSLVGITITDLTSATAPQTVTTNVAAGTRAGTGMPPAVTAIVKFKINRRYRGGHPRFYLPAGVTTDQQNAVSWTTAFISAVTNGFAAFISASVLTPPAAIGALTHVNVSYFQGFTNRLSPSLRSRPVPNLRPGGPVQDTVTGYSTNPNFGSQRRRSLQSV